MKIVVQLTNYDRSIIHRRKKNKKANNMPDVQSISSAGIVLNGNEILLSVGRYLVTFE